MAALVFRGIQKRFGAAEVLRGFDLDVAEGEAVVVVGPSGCGKTTLLRIAAGLDTADAGAVHIGERDVSHEPPGARNVAMVFQSGALYPHLTVAENIAFGMAVRRTPRDESAARVREAAGLAGCTELLGRRPGGLSGGERQRVALARALVRRPDVFLLDEPMASLDVPTREQLRAELLRLHRSVASTMVLVTHDQAEALALGDRVAVLHEGVVQQVAAPADLYWMPATRFVATFFGARTMNVLAARVVAGRVEAGPFTLGDASATASVSGAAMGASDGPGLLVGVRPEHVTVTAPTSASPSGDGLARGEIELVEHAGSDTFVTLDCAGVGLCARLPSDRRPRVGDHVAVEVRPDRWYVFDAGSDRTLAHPDPRNDDGAR